MNAFQLFREDGTPAGVWGCENCRFLAGGRDEQGQRLAEECCTPRKCQQCGAAKTEREKYSILCRACQDKKERATHLVRVESAEKLPAWDGWVYWEGYGSNEGYFDSVEDLLDWWEEERSDHEEAPTLPDYVFCCKTVPFHKADAEDVIERCAEDSFEGAADQIEGKAELAEALEIFNSANVGLVGYVPDWERMVRVPREEQPCP